MNQTFYSNGKLFITGEYVVLDGGIAFSLPTKFGQNLIAEENENDYIYWKSYDSMKISLVVNHSLMAHPYHKKSI